MTRTATLPSPTADELAAATPARRDRYVDLIRAASLGLVVVGHWLMAAVEYRHGHLGASNVLRHAESARYLTWFLQVMPLFFVVGGFSNAASLAAARRDGVSYAGWLHGRVARLGRPAAVFALVWTALAATLRIVGASGASLRTVNRMVALPLWFLAVYLLVVAVAPAMLALHHRFGLAVPVALAAGVAVVDVAGWSFGVPLVGWANFALVWLFASQLGFRWRDGRLPGRASQCLLMAGAGLAALLVMTGTASYPVSLIGGVGQARTNTDPPSLALVAATVLQLGLVLAVRGPVDRWLARPRAWAAVVRANTLAMTVYLWHLTALVAVSAVVLPRGWFPQPAPATTAWWLLRPLWLVILATVLVPLVAVFARLEHSRAERPAGRPGVVTASSAATGAVVAAAGMCALALGGFAPAGAPLGLPVLGLGLLAAGTVIVRRSVGLR